MDHSRCDLELRQRPRSVVAKVKTRTRIRDTDKSSRITSNTKHETFHHVNMISKKSDSHSQSLIWSHLIALIYILSGSTQPLLMTLVDNAGLANPSCQIYMLFYYLGPALFSVALIPCPPWSCNRPKKSKSQSPPKWSPIFKAVFITFIDIFAQSLNYTGSMLSGPTIFSIIYSSVTVWAALYSRLLLARKQSFLQWTGIVTVFLGLTITAFDSVTIGPDVFRGALMVVFGSSFHALTYVLSEIIMVKGETISFQLNCSIQGFVGVSAYLLWQIVYTRPHYQELVAEPMTTSGTSTMGAVKILLSLAASNFVHASSYFYTLKYYPGGATSAGVMKGLQAVLVFLFSSLVYCGRYGSSEMCFTVTKFISLCVVSGGVFLFGASSDLVRKREEEVEAAPSPSKQGYDRILSAEDGQELSEVL